MKHFKLHITQGSGKMENIPSINTSTLNNSFCAKMRETDSVCKSCYAARYEKMRPALVDALNSNNDLFERILRSDELPRLNHAIFRFDSFGELHNAIHLQNYFAIAEKNPETIFALWTKRKDIVKKLLKSIAKPINMILIYSSIEIGKISKLPKRFDKVFTAHKRKSVKPDVTINCQDSCNDCRLCYSHNDVVYINELLK